MFFSFLANDQKNRFKLIDLISVSQILKNNYDNLIF